MTQYSDVYIIPQYSEIRTRKEVNVGSILDSRTGLKLDVPVISANMDSVTSPALAIGLHKAGGLGALHRFTSIEDNVKHFSEVLNAGAYSLVSVGVNEESKERAQALYDAGARHFIVDIAHGEHILMKEMVTWLKTNFSDIFVVAGNVATASGTDKLISWGADAVKVGIGPGAACITKNVTGVTVPQFLAVKNCAHAANRNHNRKVPVIADGGVTEIGDIAKALAVGADFVMSGRLFASCLEAPLPGVYRGSASASSMKTYKDHGNLPTPEGKEMRIETEYSVTDLTEAIKGGLQSAFSYSNSRNLFEFKRNALIGYK